MNEDRQTTGDEQPMESEQPTVDVNQDGQIDDSDVKGYGEPLPPGGGGARDGLVSDPPTSAVEGGVGGTGEIGGSGPDIE